MDATDRDEPDRDPVLARKTSRPCAIEDGDVPPSGWDRLKRLFRRRRSSRPAKAEDFPPLEPESIPEPPEEPRLPEGPDEF
jgi:hypothetical protein